MEDKQLVRIINNRYKSSEELNGRIKAFMKANEPMYRAGTHLDDYTQGNIPAYIYKMPWYRTKIRANRIFTNVEAVINSLIANPPQIELIPNREGEDAQELVADQEKLFTKKYADLNVKEQFRKGLRFLYLGRLIVLKPFWNPSINDFDVKVVDPRKIRISKKATKEEESDFIIEDIDDTLENLVSKFPSKKEGILKKVGYSDDQLVEQPMDIIYQEAWLDYGKTVTWKFRDLILETRPNPYWDWEGLQASPEELFQLESLQGEERRLAIGQLRQRKEQIETTPNEGENSVQEAPIEPDQSVQQPNEQQPDNSTYYFNYFDKPRSPYIFATVLNYEQSPVGQTDFISQAASLQESVDKRKMQIDQNAQIVNGVTLVDASVMSKKDAAAITWETGGFVWGTNVLKGVKRETGSPLPEFVYQDMIDSREEIDNIMAATSAFRGEREGTETKAGRLALVEQSFMRLNELVQVIDYVSQELFSWFYQLAKVNYTEAHYTKIIGSDKAKKVLEIMQDDFLDGTEVKVIPGKSLPEDKQFKFQRAQEDVAKGIIAPIDYFKEANYTDPTGTAQRAVLFGMNPAKLTGIPDEVVAQFAQVPQVPQVPEQQSQIPPQ